jgi:hypothetical protein
MISICFIVFLLISILTSSYGQVTCPPGWVQEKGSCYLIKPAFIPGGSSGGTRGTWDKCNAYCTASYPGATMFCINDAAEHNWIWSQSGDYFLWIGYTDMLPYGGGKGTKQYGWVTGCTSTYTNWMAGQPNNEHDNSDYAFFNYYGGGKWYNGTPQDEINCGCEYNPASEGSVSE